MPANNPWPIGGGPLTLDPSDARLAAVTDFLALHSPDPDQPLVVAKVTAGDDGASLSGRATAWGSDKTELKFAWFGDTEAVKRIALSKPIAVFDGITLPILAISDLRQHCAAEVREASGNAEHTGGISGLLKVGERLIAFDLEGYGLPAFDLRIDFEAPANATSQPPGLRDLAALLGLAEDPHADLQWLPTELQSAQLITLKKMSARIEPADARKLTQVEVTLGFLGNQSWPLIPGFHFLEVGELEATLAVEHPLESEYRFPRLTVRGTVKLDKVSDGGGDAHVDLSARWPDLAVEGALHQKEKILLAKLFEHLGVPSTGLPEGGRALAITELGFLAEPTMGRKRFSFHAAVENAWELELPGGKSLAIKRLSFSLPYQEGESPTMKPNLSGVIGIGELEVALEAEREADGWRFAGSSAPGKKINVGEWIKDLAGSFGVVEVPGPVAGADLKNVAVTFHTGTKDFHFSIEAKLPLTDIATKGASGASSAKELELTLSLDLVHHGDVFEKKFAGEIQLGGRKFDLNFSKTGAASGASGTTMVAAYQNRDGDKVTMKELLAAVGANVSEVPDGLSVTLHSALFALEKSAGTTGASWKVFGINIDGGLNLSNLPLIGKVLPANETLSLEFQALFSSRKIEGKDVKDLVNPVNALLPPGATPLPTVGNDDTVIAEGIGLATTLHLGSEVIHLNLPVKIDKTAPNGIKGPSATTGGGAPGPTPGSKIVQTDSGPVALPEDGLKWFPIHKSFGPAHFERIGAGLDGKKVTFAMDASLNVGGLSLSLDGLGVSSPLDKFDPSFQLRGIGIDYANGPVEIGGSFLRLGEDNFAGTALIKAEKLTLSAIGAYAKVDNQTSLFVYAVLDYPLGGPSFFFVTGLAAGFGYNRSLLMPPIEELPTFPLVAEATAGAGLPKDVMAELKKLGQYVPPDVGQYFLAVGVKFNSFKLIDSFALLAVSFGKRFEIDVLGQSTVVVPTQIPGAVKVDPVARITIALLARFIPDEGLLAVDARITPGSFILSEKCHLTGGFSFYAWFKGTLSGDFVVTLGGYHPAFAPPPHYPQVPRLAFTWQVVPELVVKGDAYCALTSHAVMAGGHLEASYQSGPLRAHFKVGADFLISWQPYRYDAEAYIDVGGSYDSFLGTISVDLGAHLHIWGPEFAGTAELDLYVATVHVTFGDQTQHKDRFIEWRDFKKAFLPDEKAVVSLALEAGLIAAGNPKKPHLGIINPKELRIVTNSLIPSTKLRLGTESAHDLGEKVSVASVNIAECTSIHTVTIVRSKQDVTDEFQIERVIKKLPAALWGTPNPGDGKPKVNAEEKLVPGITGVRLTPKAPATAHASRTVASDDLEWDEPKPPQALPAENFSQFWNDEIVAPGAPRREIIGRTVTQPEVVVARNLYLTSLKLDPANVRVGGLTGEMFHAEPRMGLFAEPAA